MDTDAVLGATITFSVAVTGYDTFQWFGPGGVMLNTGGRILGANTRILRISDIMATDAGDYFVDVAVSANPAITEQSNTATVTLVMGK